jgi:hypothetical protein
MSHDTIAAKPTLTTDGFGSAAEVRKSGRSGLLLRSMSMITTPNIHDHSLLEYRVDLANRRITLVTLPEVGRSDPTVKPRHTVFEGREGHNFSAVSSGVVFLDIEEIPLFGFLKSHQTEFDESSRMFGAPS